jgi:phthalate 4,5-cis-dihydrodiol dehydrogenase
VATTGRGATYAAVAAVAAAMPEIAFVPPTFASDDDLFGNPNVDAVWIGPPNPLHASRAIAAMSAGKHVIVEKPMALTLDDATAMIAAAERNGVVLLAGHTSYSYQLPIRAMRRIALSGAIGAPRAITIWSATDWMLRPRPSEQADPDAGAGIVHRQAPHQIETLRLLAPSQLTSVRASIGSWMPGRAEPGFYTALFTFEDGMSATITHNGHGYFMTLDLFAEAALNHPYDENGRVALRRAIHHGTLRDAGAPKVGANWPDEPWSPIDLGLVILSCERGDVRHAAHGIAVYDGSGRHDVDLRPRARERLRGHTDLGGGAIVQALLELSTAVRGVRPLVHNGAWGRASLEATLALIASAHGRAEVPLRFQTALPAAFDADLHVG